MYDYFSGIYGDQVNEMSWAVGEIIQTLREMDKEKETLFVFTSDNGPQVEFCEEGGMAAPFRGCKLLSFCEYGSCCFLLLPS